MRLQILIFCLFISLVLSAQNDTKVLECSGSIADKYPIKMVLKIDSGKAIGYYYYEKYAKKILLTGEINGSRIILNESPDVGVGPDFVLGFIGQINKNVISGVWKDVSRRKSLKFSIK